MPGKGPNKRYAAVARKAYVLRRQGMTNRQIAELVGRHVEQVPKLIEFGERFAEVPSNQSAASEEVPHER